MQHQCFVTGCGLLFNTRAERDEHETTCMADGPVGRPATVYADRDRTPFERRAIEELNRAGDAQEERYERYHLARAQVFATLATVYFCEGTRHAG